MNHGEEIKFLTKKDEDEFLLRLTNPTYRLIALIMLDCCTRMTETISLQMHCFNWQKKTVTVKTDKQYHKKKGDNTPKKVTYRTLILTDRILECAALHLKKNKKIDISNPNQYLFPKRSSKNLNPHLSRSYIHKHFQQRSDNRIHAHMLRHTGASKLAASGSDIVVIKEILGHKNIQNTSIYLHASMDRKRQAVNRLQTFEEPKYRQLLRKLLPSLYKKKVIYSLPTTYGWTRYHIGRKQELRELRELSDKKVNIILLAEQGMGKSHLLDNYDAPNVLRIDDTKDFKKTLAGLLMTIIERNEQTGKEGILKNESNQSSKEIALELLGVNRNIITQQSVKRLIELMKRITQPNEYTIIIDKADDVTPSVIKALEEMRNHFHFIVAARKIKVESATWLTNFTQIKLKPLSYSESIELIVRASEDFRQQIEDFESYKNHLWVMCQGNPQFTLEAIDRFRKEDYVSIEAVTNYEHIGSLKEIDMTYFFVFALSTLMILRYVAKEIGHDEDAFKLFGGAALIFALFARQIHRLTKKRYI